MNTNDLPPAARLAALIEAGRIANPGIPFNGDAYWHNGCGCALMFAARGAGIDVQSAEDVMAFMDRAVDWAGVRLLDCIEEAAHAGFTPEEIVKSLREGEFARIAA